MIDESIRVFDLPRMFESAEELDYVADKLWPYFRKKFEKKGFRLIDRSDVGGLYVVSKSKIETLAGLRSAKLWQASDDSLLRAQFKKLGLNGVSLALSDVDAALSSDKIDASYGTPLTALTLGWSSKVKFMASMPMSFSLGATVLSMDAYKKLSSEDAKTLENVTRASAKNMRDAIRKANEDARTMMTAKGVTMASTPAAMVEDFDRLSSEVWNELAGTLYSKADLKMVLDARAEYRAKRAKQ